MLFHTTKDRQLRPTYRFFFLQLFLFYSLLAFGTDCVPPGPESWARRPTQGSIADDVLNINPAGLKRRHRKAHFRETAPLELVPGETDASAVPIRLMSVNFQHLLPSQHDAEAWRAKLVGFGRTMYIEKPDLISANEVYQAGMDEFGPEVLKPLGYEWLVDSEGGKAIFGGQMSVGFIYNPQKFKVLETQSIPIDVPEAVDQTRNLFRVTLQMHVGGLPLIVYVVHFKSGMRLKTPIPTPDGKPIKTSNQLRFRQMKLLRTHVEQDMAAGHTVLVMGDFNTPFVLKDFVKPDTLEPKEPTKDDKWMVWSANPIHELIEAGRGVDSLTDVPGYSHVYRKHGSKLDHVLVFPATAQSSSCVVTQIQDRMFLRYPWHVDSETGFPSSNVVSDHLPLLAEILLIPSTATK